MKNYLVVLLVFLCLYLGICLNILLAQNGTKQESTQKANNTTVFKERYLALDRLGITHKRIRYMAGDEIIYKTEKAKIFQEATIIFVSDTSLYIAEYAKPINLKQIEAIRRYSQSGIVRQGRKLFFLAAVGFFALDLFSMPTRDLRVLPNRSYISNGSMVLSGVLCNVFYRRTYKINKRNILRAMIQP